MSWVDRAILTLVITTVVVLVLYVARWVGGPLAFYGALALVLVVEAALTLHLLRRRR